MDDTGISELISAVIIIGLVIGLSAIIFAWSQGLINLTLQESNKLAKKSIECYRDIYVDIISACTIYNEIIKITIENGNANNINGDFFLIRAEDPENGVIIPTRPFTNLGPFERKTLEVSYPKELSTINKISLITRLEYEDESIFCTDNPAVIENIREC